jgi:ABC-2 type transport system ATP-binding protein
MDEAERCHRIAYLAWSKLLLEGPVDEVVARSGLTTWAVTGPDLADLQHQLKGRPGLDMVAAFGTALHVTGTDPAEIEASIAPFRADPRYAWEPAPASLEDVFIHTLALVGADRR